MIARAGIGAGVLAAVLGGPGCAADPSQGYSGTTVFPQEVSTVAVEIFENRSYDRDLEFELADALVKEIEARTPYKVTSASRADTILTGRIRSSTRSQLSKSPLTGLSEEVTVSVTIDLTWKDVRSGEALLELESYTAHSMFIPSNPTREPIELGQFGAVQRLAKDIVDEMRGAW